MRNIVKCEGFFLGEKGFISLFTHTYTSSQWQKFLLGFAWGSKMQFQYKPCTGWIMGIFDNLLSVQFLLRITWIIDFRKINFITFYAIYVIPSAFCISAAFPGLFVFFLFVWPLPNKKTLPDLSLGGFPLGNAPGEFLEQHLPLTYEFLLASGIFPLLPVPAGKFLVNLAPVWTLQAD